MVNMCPSRFTPYDEPDYPCEICGEIIDNCICDECPICGDYGNPTCYRDHGMKRTELQRFYLECNEREWAKEIELENEYFNQLDEESKLAESWF